MAASDGGRAGLKCGLAEIAMPEPLNDAAEDDQVWPLVIQDWRGVASAAERRFSAIPDHVRILTEGDIFLEAIGLVRNTPATDDMIVAIGRLPGGGLHAQWVEAVRERGRQGGRTILRFSANFDNARSTMNELAAEFPGKIDYRQVPQFFGCYVASPKAVIVAVEGMAAPMYRNLMRGTPFAFGFLLRGKIVGINFNKSLQAMLQLPEGKWWDTKPECEPVPPSGASAIHREWRQSRVSDGPVAALRILVGQLKGKPHLYPVLDSARAEINDPALDMALLKAGALSGLGASLHDLAAIYWRQGQLVETVLVSSAAREREDRPFLPPHLLNFAWLVGLGREEEEDVTLPSANSSEAEVRACWALAAISLLRGSGRWCLGARFLDAPIRPDFNPLTDLVLSAAQRAYTYPDSPFPYRELAELDAIGDDEPLRDEVRGQLSLIQTKKFDKPGVSRVTEKMLSASMPVGKLSKCLSSAKWRDNLVDLVDAEFSGHRKDIPSLVRTLVRDAAANFDAGTEQFLAKMFIRPLKDTFELYNHLVAVGPLQARIHPEDLELWRSANHYLRQREEVSPPDDLAAPVEDCLRTMITGWRREHVKP